MKFTLKVDPEYSIQAVITARRVLREYASWVVLLSALACFGVVRRW